MTTHLSRRHTCKSSNLDLMTPCTSFSLCPFVCMSVSSSICLAFCLFLRLSLSCLSACWFPVLFVSYSVFFLCLSHVCLYVCFQFYLSHSVYFFVCLSLSLICFLPFLISLTSYFPLSLCSYLSHVIRLQSNVVREKDEENGKVLRC